MSTVDLLAIFPHPDDAELTCGGTLLKSAKQGHRVGILDLSAGEMASRGSVSQRSDESTKAAELLRVSVRENLGLPDSGLTNTPETRLMVARVIRRLKPTIVITTAPSPFGRHPDHRVTAELVRDACFISGLKTIAPELAAHRPRKVIHSITYREDNLRKRSWRRLARTPRSFPEPRKPVKSIRTVSRCWTSSGIKPRITGR
jgi:bacillithiol biosynthesis deacetylase BshB1